MRPQAIISGRLPGSAGIPGAKGVQCDISGPDPLGEAGMEGGHSLILRAFSASNTD